MELQLKIELYVIQMTWEVFWINASIFWLNSILNITIKEFQVYFCIFQPS